MKTKPRKDMIGKKFGRLTVLKQLDDDITVGGNHVIMYLCKCECGKEVKTQGNHLRSGHTNSCGCYKSDRVKETQSTVAINNPRLYGIWEKMKYRCNNSNYKQYELYGGRGIKVCEEWNEFKPFYEWAINNGYNDKLTIDRINVNGNYEPNNCRWVDKYIQARNKRNNVLIEDENGELLVLEVFAQKYKLNRSTVKYRYLQGDRGQRLIRKSNENKYNYKNEW